MEANQEELVQENELQQVSDISNVSAEELLQQIQEQKEQKKSGGILLPFLITLLVLVGIIDLALATYIGFYYVTTGTQQIYYSETGTQSNAQE